MTEKPALEETLTERRRRTRSSIYHYLYSAEAPCAKQKIAADLNLSLPTVYQNLTELAEAGLIDYAGAQPSSGGRPAMNLAVVAGARVSVGVSITEHRLRFILTDLKLNELGGANGIGLLDIVENRLVGMKCRGVYETPGGAILYKAHSVLETLCLDKMTMHEKQKIAITFAELVYNGQWFTPLREALSAFVDKTQETVTGKVKLKLYKGNMINAGVWSPNSLYSEEIATFGESDYNQKDAEGFINLYGLPIQVQALVNGAK